MRSEDVNTSVEKEDDHAEADDDTSDKDEPKEADGEKADDDDSTEDQDEEKRRKIKKNRHGEAGYEHRSHNGKNHSTGKEQRIHISGIGNIRRTCKHLGLRSAGG